MAVTSFTDTLSSAASRATAGAPTRVVDLPSFGNNWSNVARTASAQARADEAAPDGLLGAAMDFLGNRFVSTALSVIDMPRRFVTSTLKETFDSAVVVGEGFSAGDWWNQTVHAEQQIGVGDYVDTGNIWLDRSVGFAGDVALDPLTYLTLGTGKVAQLGATGVARASFRAAAAQTDNVIARQLDDIGRQVLNRHYTSLSSDQWQYLNRYTPETLDLRGGTRINVGRTRVGQAVARSVTGGRTSSLSLRLVPDDLARLTPRGLGLSGFQRVRQGSVSRRIFDGKFVSGDRQAARQMMSDPGTDSRTVRDAFMMMDHTNEGRFVRRAFDAEVGSEWDSIRSRLKGNHGNDWGRRARSALDGNVEAQEALGADWAELKGFADGLTDRGNTVSGRQFLTHRDNWYPKALSEGFHDFLNDSGGTLRNRSSFTKTSFENKAGIVAGADFMGERLLDPATEMAHLPKSARIGVVEQAWEIFQRRAHDQGGIENAAKWFSDDLDEAMPQYIHQLSRRVGEQKILQRMEESGIARSQWTEANARMLDTPEGRAGWLRAGNEVRKLRREMYRQEQSVNDAAVDVAVAREMADEADRVARETSETAEGVASAAAGARAVADRDVYASSLTGIIRERDKAWQSLQDTARTIGFRVKQKNELLSQLDAAERRVTADVLAAGEESAAGTSAVRPTAAGDVRASTHDLERQVIEVEREIADLQGQLDSAGAEAGDLLGSIHLREDAAKRIDERLELMDEASRLDAESAATGGAFDQVDGNVRRSQIARRMAELDQARVVPVVGQDGVVSDLDALSLTGSGELTRENLEAAREVALHEASMMRSFTNMREGRNLFGPGAGSAAMRELKRLLPVEDRLYDLRELHRGMADEWAALQGADPGRAVSYLTDVNLPTAGSDGFLRLRSPNGNETNVFFTAVGDEISDVHNPIRPRGTDGAVDTWLGRRVSNNPHESSLFNEGQERLAGVSVSANNPRVYASDAVLGDSLLDPLDKAVDTRGGYGSGRGVALTQLQNDIMTDAFRSGDLSPAKIAGAARARAVGATAKGYGQTGRWKRLVEALGGVAADDWDGIAAAFDVSFRDMFRGHTGRRIAELPRERWIMNRVVDDVFGNNGFATARHKADAADGWRARLQSDGFDSVMYNGRDGNWNVFALDQRQLVDARYLEPDDFGSPIVGGNASYVAADKAVRDAEINLANRVTDSEALARRRIESEFGSLLGETNATLHALGRLQDETATRFRDLSDRVVDLSTKKNRAGMEAAAAEAQEWSVVQGMLDMSTEQRGRYADKLGEFSRNTENVAARAQADAHLALARVAELEALHAGQVNAMRQAAGSHEAAVAASNAAFEKLTRNGGEISDAQLGQMQRVFLDGYSRVGDDLLVPDWAMAAMRDQGRIASLGPDNPLRGLLRAYDGATRLFKTMAISTPGFHARNLFSGMFNNMLADISPGTYSRFAGPFATFERALRGSPDGRRFSLGGRSVTVEEATERALSKIKNPRDREAFRILVEDGHLTGNAGGGRSEDALAAVSSRTNNPFSTSFRFYQFNRRVGGTTENFLRGSLAFDRIRGGLEAAVDAPVGTAVDVVESARAAARSDVFRFHFDYEDLSAVEAGVFRRMMPFYTWTRKNFPLQLEMMMANPRAYQRFNALARNAAIGQEEQEGILPDYIQNQLHVKLPVGDNKYWVPDLPFSELTRTLVPSQLAASANPILRAPAEVMLNRKFFTGSDVDYGIQRLPNGLDQIVNQTPLGEALVFAGIAGVTEDGEIGMSSRAQWLLSQNIPIWSQLDRLVPNAEHRQRRVWDARVNYVFGVGAYTLNDHDRERALAKYKADNGVSYVGAD